MIYEYWKSRLNAAEQRAYDACLKAFAYGGGTAACGVIDPYRADDVYMAVVRDHPEFFFLPSKFGVGAGITTKISVLPVYDERTMRDLRSRLDKEVAEFVYSVKSIGSDENKERAVVDYLLERVDYAIDNTYNQNAASAIVTCRAQCSGIARAAKLIFDRLGMQSMVVAGMLAGGPHEWNIVKINGEFTHLDITSILGANEKKTKPFRYPYFNCSDAEMRKTHAWELPTPCCVGTGKGKISSVEVNEDTAIVPSLYELRSKLKAAVSGGKTEFCAVLEIKMPTEKYLEAVKKCCGEVSAQLGVRLAFEIRLSGKNVRINWR